MKAVIFKECGAWNDKLELAEINLEDPGAEEVQIKIVARPINPSDEMFIYGVYRQKPVFPQIAGLEGAGIIEKSGRLIARDLVGRHVIFRTRNTWAERINLKLSQIRLVPNDLNFETTCQLSLNTLTGYALLEESNLSAGEWLILTAANSTICRQIIQLAKRKNLKVIAIVRKDGYEAMLKNLGATEVLNSENDNLEKQIMAITGNGVNAILDAVGGKLGSVLFKAAASKSKIIIYGRLSDENVSFYYGTVVYKNLKIEGFGIDSWIADKKKSELDSIWSDIIYLVNNKLLQVSYDKIYELQNFKEAINYYQKTGNKVILK